MDDNMTTTAEVVFGLAAVAVAQVALGRAQHSPRTKSNPSVERVDRGRRAELLPAGRQQHVVRGAGAAALVLAFGVLLFTGYMVSERMVGF
jgi:hypothetical protein